MKKIEQNLINLIGLYIAFDIKSISKESNQTLSYIETIILEKILIFNFYNKKITVDYYHNFFDKYQFGIEKSVTENTIKRLVDLGFIFIEKDIYLIPTEDLLNCFKIIANNFYSKKQKRRADLIDRIANLDFTKLSSYQKFNFYDSYEDDLRIFWGMLFLELYYDYYIKNNLSQRNISNAFSVFEEKKSKLGQLCLLGDYYDLRGMDNEFIETRDSIVSLLRDIIINPQSISKEIMNLVFKMEQNDETSEPDFDMRVCYKESPPDFIEFLLNHIWYAAKKEYRKMKMRGA